MKKFAYQKKYAQIELFNLNIFFSMTELTADSNFISEIFITGEQGPLTGIFVSLER